LSSLFFLGLIIGTLVAEFTCSGSLSDKLVLRLAARNNGIKTAEMRLWLVYPAAILTGSKFCSWQLQLILTNILEQLGSSFGASASTSNITGL